MLLSCVRYPDRLSATFVSCTMKDLILTVAFLLVAFAPGVAAFAVGRPQRSNYLSVWSCSTRDDFTHQPRRFEVTIETTVVAPSYQSMDRVLQCAESQGECSLDEMETMIKDFERLNNNCQKPDGECMVDAIEARKVLRDALMLQTNLAKVRIELSNTPYYLNVWRTDAGAKRPQKVVQDHSFSRYLDYRDIGDYESH